jgi:hypothetical protein
LLDSILNTFGSNLRAAKDNPTSLSPAAWQLIRQLQGSSNNSEMKPTVSSSAGGGVESVTKENSQSQNKTPMPPQSQEHKIFVHFHKKKAGGISDPRIQHLHAAQLVKEIAPYWDGRLIPQGKSNCSFFALMKSAEEAKTALKNYRSMKNFYFLTTTNCTNNSLYNKIGVYPDRSTAELLERKRKHQANKTNKADGAADDLGPTQGDGKGKETAGGCRWEKNDRDPRLSRKRTHEPDQCTSTSNPPHNGRPKTP